ncbi:DUF4142 domain-containing protein [Actinomadura darangshiensis]|uniref:DUF4142 domain-containing protein n=1 Tax=Actinomadura darangshiensis TaxID=705336 RepID=A0A4R5BC07_9ACTN|nr:DUF4142 domain-containing protein [Actinomadura darangshiensis]TDD82719.1 DUF4142 domain-containing protein [Actinomadura darangshiensis]
MRTPLPGVAAACGLAAMLLLGACTATGRQASDGAAVAPSPADEAAQQSTVDTKWGPLGPADRDLIVRVRQAALWEIPVGRQAQRRAARTTTRRNLGEIARRHAGSDALARQAAVKLNVPLPDQPTPEQQSWLSEITGKSGNDYDRTAIARMRTADGLLYASIGAVRGSTRNTLVRAFAEKCEPAVRARLKLLEGTGFVTGDTLPDPPQVASAPLPGNPKQPASPAPAATALLAGR